MAEGDERMNLSTLARWLYALGVTPMALPVMTRRRRLAVTFHGVISRRCPELPDWAQPELTTTDLKAIVGWLGQRFPLLTPEQYLQGAASGVLITFDDGFSNNWLNALPVLEKAQAPAIFFVTTQHVSDPRDWLPWKRELARRLEPFSPAREVLDELFSGVEVDVLRSTAGHRLLTVGAHTVSHPRLPGCSADELETELVGARRQLQDWVGGEVALMAYPFGAYDRRVAEAVDSAGYRAAFAEDRSGEAPARFELPRIGLYSSARPYLYAKLCGLHRRGLGPAEVSIPPRSVA